MLGADAGTFAAVFVSLYAAHEVGDHWVQTDTQALTKGKPGKDGRTACAAHVASLVITKGVFLTVACVVLGLGLHPLALVAGLGVDAVSHYWADRRSTLARLAERIGKGDFARLGDGFTAPTGTGAYALDQSWHIGFLFVAALVMCLGVAS